MSGDVDGSLDAEEVVLLQPIDAGISSWLEQNLAGEQGMPRLHVVLPTDGMVFITSHLIAIRTQSHLHS